MRPETGRIVSVLRRNLQLTRGKSPGSQMATRARTALLPRRYCRVVLRASLLCLQWRDRAGIAPDFPFKPVVGTIGQFICTTAIQRLLSAAAQSGLVDRAATVPRDPAPQAIQRKMRYSSDE
jgi:hypothetical protein